MTVAFWFVAKLPVVTLNVADVAAGATVTDAGTVRDAQLFDRETVAPPAGAAFDSVTVHVLLAFEPRLLGEQVTEDTRPGAARLIAAVPVLPL